MSKKQALKAAFDAKKLEIRLSKAKTNLILEYPFIGTIALNMPFILSDEVPTAATNGKRVLFNPEFITDLTDDELKFLVAHECMHPMLEHNYRRHERNHKKWNQAGDYVINKLLVDEQLGKMPSMGLHSDDIYKAGSGSTDGIYNILPEPEDDGEEGSGMDICQDAPGGEAEKTQAQAEMKIKVAQAAQAAKMMGKMSANLQRLVDEVLNPKVDWREVLQRFILKQRTDQRTYARPNRRFITQGIYSPSVSGEVMGELLFAIDCSGSIDANTVNQFAAEITCVKDDCNPTRIHVVYFDSKVSHYESYGQDDTLDIKPHGGGGTAFSPVFEYAAEHGIDPVACVFLTDLCCDDFGDTPDYPVLWVSTCDGTAPFGEIVLM